MLNFKSCQFSNVFNVAFTSPNASDADGYLTVKKFHSHFWYFVAKRFCKREKNPSVINGVKFKS